MKDIKKTCNDLWHMIKAAGLSVDLVCKDAGISKQAFYHWSSGQREPTLRNFHSVTESYYKLKWRKEHGERSRQEKK